MSFLLNLLLPRWENYEVDPIVKTTIGQK